MKTRRRFRTGPGFSLIDNLISMALFLFIVLGVFEVFSISRNQFIEIKTSQEVNTAACASLDKIRADLGQCGRGFAQFNSPKYEESLSVEDNILILREVKQELSPISALSAGQTRISLENTSDLKKGMELYIEDALNSEIQTIFSVDSTGAVLSSPLSNSYQTEKATLHLLYKVSFYLDAGKKILRRKVNGSPAQPLCEEVNSFDCTCLREANLVKIYLTLLSNPENIYEISIFPKNTALCICR